MLPGGSGALTFWRQPDGRQDGLPFPPASRVSISELLGRCLVRTRAALDCNSRDVQHYQYNQHQIHRAMHDNEDPGVAPFLDDECSDEGPGDNEE